MTFSQFLSILRARWKVLLSVLGFTVAVTLAVSLMLPKSYTATASVVVDAKPDPLAAMMYSSLTTPAFIATQVDVIQSDRVAFRVARNLKLGENPQIRAQWIEATNGEGSIEQWLSELFRKNMDVLPSRESNVIAVAYKAPDPGFAAALANAFVQAYIETSLELRVDPARQYNSFFDSRAKEARDALEKAQGKLSAYQNEHGLIASDERLDVETTRLNELSSQLVLVQALSSESGSRQAQARGASADKLQEVLNNPLISGLKSDMSRAEARLQELNARLGDKHPQVIETKANIAELNRRIQAETARVSGGVGVSASINRQREAELKASLEAQRAKVLHLKEVRDEAAVLVRDVENAQRAFDAITARMNQNNLESQATQSNVNVLTQATAPLEPSSPKLILNTILSIFLGGLIAVGIVLMMELMDRRLRAVDEIAGFLDMPVLGVIPHPSAKKSSKKTAVQMERRIMAKLPAAKGVN
jgi:chain length determinant protein EpsF